MQEKGRGKVILFRLPLAFARLLFESIFLALGQIWTNKGRSILTTIGIVIGVGAVTAVIAALTGLKANVLSQFESFGVNNIFVISWRPDSGPHQYASWSSLRFRPDEFDGLLENCPSVAGFTRIGGRLVPVRYRDRSTGAWVRGIDPGWHKIRDRSVTLGRPFSLIDNSQARFVCLITSELQDRLHLDRDCVGQLIYVGRRTFLIVGIVESPVGPNSFWRGGGPEEVLIPFGTYWRLFGGHLYAIAASRSPSLSEEAQAELRFFLRGKRNLKPGDPNTFFLWAMQSWVDRFERESRMATWIAGGVAAISLLVGGVGIMNIMLVSVSERTREIGIRKAVGAKSSAVLLQFLVEAVVLCLVGGLIGVLFGQGLTTVMAHIPEMKLDKAYIPLWAIGISFGFSALVGVLFGMMPAVKAACVDPIQALRHE